MKDRFGKVTQHFQQVLVSACIFLYFYILSEMTLNSVIIIILQVLKPLNFTKYMALLLKTVFCAFGNLHHNLFMQTEVRLSFASTTLLLLFYHEK